MDTTRAKRKLREARFFLERLREEEGRAVRQEPEAFDFYLSALLSAAVSVIYVLRHENGEEFDRWLSEWKRTARSPEEVRL